MIRNALLLLSSSLLLVACGGRSENPKSAETAAPAPAPVADALDQAATPDAPALDIPALPDIVAKVDDMEIAAADLAKLIDPMLKRHAANLPDPTALAEATSHLRKEALDHLILQRLLQREAAAKGISATDADIDEFLKKRLPPDTTLEKVAEAQGLTVADIRADIATGLTIEKHLEAIVDELAAVTDDEAKAEFDKIASENPDAFKKPESVQASHILVKVEKGADDATKAAARAKIDELRQKIVDGADFAEVAKENSDCPSKQRGGDLGTFGRGQMVKPFEEAAFSQPIGELGPVVETDFGFHIIKVTDRTEAGERTFDEMKDQLKEYLGNQRKEKKVSEYIESVRTNAKIETFLPEIVIPEPPPAEPAQRPLPQWAE